MEITIAILSSGIAAFIWLFFFRVADHFKPEPWGNVFLFFLLGGLSVLIPMFTPYLIGEGEGAKNVVLHHLIDVAFIEETGKFLLFLLGMFFMKKRFTDGPNYLIYGAAVGVGFGCVENVMYALQYGNLVLHFRDIVSISLHAFCTAIVCYGFFKLRAGNAGLMLLWYLTAISIHAGYNSGFVLAGEHPVLPIVSSILFLVAVEIFSVMLNNAVNGSIHFEDHLPFPAKAMRISLLWTFLFLFLLFMVNYIVEYGFIGIGVFLFLSTPLLFVLYVAINRISSPVLVRGKVFPIGFSLPFRLGGIDIGLPGVFGARFSVKGLPYEEYPFVSRINSETEIRPINSRFDYFGDTATISITGKVYAKSQIIFYPVRFIHSDDPIHEDRHYYLMPKFSGESQMGENCIAALISREQPIDSATEEIGKGGFCAWIYLKKEPDLSALAHFKRLLKN